MFPYKHQHISYETGSWIHWLLLVRKFVKETLTIMLLVIHGVDKLLRIFFASLALWSPFRSYMVNCAVLPVSYALPNNTNPIVSTAQNSQLFYCTYERSWTDILNFEYRDCFAARMYMLYVETQGPTHAAVLREFYTRVVRPSGTFVRPLVTPRKYVTRESSNLCKSDFPILPSGCRISGMLKPQSNHQIRVLWPS